MPDHSPEKVRKKKTVTLKKLKNWFLTIIGLFVIFLAISFTLVRVAIKSIPDYSSAIQEAVSEQLDITLEVGFLDAEIHWLVPRLNLIDVNVSDKAGVRHLLHLEEIDLSLDWAESIKSMSPVVGEITLVGLNIQIGINNKSQLLIQNYVVDENIDDTLSASSRNNLTAGFKVSEALKYSINNLDFKVLNSQVRFYDDRHKQRSKTLTKFNLHLINSGDSHVIEVRANLPAKYGNQVHFIVDVDGDLFDYKKLDGDLYVALKNINAASWFDDYWYELMVSANANVSGQFWLEWSQMEITDITSIVHVSNLAVNYLDKDVNTWSVDQLDAQLRWSKDNNDWKLDVRDLVVEREGIDWLMPAAATLKMNGAREEVKLQADFLRIEGFVYLAGMLKSVTETDITWLDLLVKYRPSGELINLDVQLPVNEPQNIKINTEFSQLGFSMPDTEPAEIVNLKGSVAYLDNKTWLNLDSKNIEIKFNELFRNSINLKQLKGTLELSHQSRLWELSTPSLIVNTAHLETEMRFNYNMPDDGLAFLDLTAFFKGGDAKYVSSYLPVGVMGKETVAWIDKALSNGKITQGAYQFYGCIDDAPFRNGQGVSLAELNATDVDLSYLDNWPIVEDAAANLRFENDSMHVDVYKGRVFGSEIKEATVYIDNFISPTLDIKGKVDTRLSDIKKFVNESALREDVTDYINNLQLAGKGDLELEIFLPLYGDYYTEVGGRLLIENGQIKFKKENYELKNINGLVRFAGDTVESSDLKGELSGNLPGRLLDFDIKTQRSHDVRSYQIGVKGNVLASSMLAQAPDYKAYFNGSADWDIEIDIANDKARGETTVNTHLVSDLQGVTTSLPGPLAKTSEKASPVEIDISVKPGSSIIYSLAFENGDKLKVNRLQNKLLMRLDMQSIKGNVDVNLLENIDVPARIDLDYLDLNKFFRQGEKDASISQSADLAESKVLKIKPSPGATVKAVSPRELPSVDFSVKKLKWKQAVYNDSTLKTQRSKLGAVIKSFKFTGDDHVVTGKGSWFTGRNDVSTTKLDLHVKVNDLGKVFKDLEISDSLYATSGNINLRWQWKDVPYKFDWKKLAGDGNFKLRDGTLKELDAGAGRLLGLLNFKTLLSLDFGSQMKEGFNFDNVSGSISFADGNMYSDDFEIESKVADIHMQGRLNIAENTINQTVTVKPQVGATLTLGAAVVAGPTIGGLVYLFQKIFNTDRLSEYQYTMKGSIDNPEVKLISAPVEEQEDESDY